MKYKAIIETDEFENFEFYEDGNGKFIQGIDASSVNGEWIALYFTECKQESVLDKIRVEVEQAAKDYDKFDDYRRVRGLWIALDIIDKYKGESKESLIMNQEDYGIEILEELKQLDYELHIRIGKSHLSEVQWDWLIENFKEASIK